MPDLLDRTKREEEAAAVIALFLSRLHDDVAARVNSPPNELFWAGKRDELALLLRNQLGPAFADSFGVLVDQFGDSQFDAQPLSASLADQWSASQAFFTATQVIQNTRQELADLAAKARQEEDAAAAILLLMGGSWAFAPSRAENIAVTELTRANIAGEQSAAAGINAGTLSGSVPGDRQGGLNAPGLPPIFRDKMPVKKIVAVWHTEQDNRVCPRCAPLNGRPEGNWGEFPLGPPAHVNCRCFLTWEETAQ